MTSSVPGGPITVAAVDENDVTVQVAFDSPAYVTIVEQPAPTVAVSEPAPVTATVTEQPAPTVAVSEQPAPLVKVTEETPPAVVLQDSSGQGIPGADAYQIACSRGFTGTVDQWLASLGGKTLEFEYVKLKDGVEQFSIPGPCAAVQSYFLNGLRERTSNFQLQGSVVTTPAFTVYGDLIVVLYYPS